MEIFRAILQLMKERNIPMIFFPFFVFKHFFKGYFLILCSELSPPGISEKFHKLRGVNIGKDVYIDRHARIDGAYPEKIFIGDQVRITSGACVVAHIKAGKHLRENYFPSVVREVKIDKYAFIGLNAVILPGITVGEGAVVANNSVVFRNVPPYCVVSGNPAKIVSRLKPLNATKDPSKGV